MPEPEDNEGTQRSRHFQYRMTIERASPRNLSDIRDTQTSIVSQFYWKCHRRMLVFD